MSQHSESNCKHETGPSIEDKLLKIGTEVQKIPIGSEWDENDLELCIINSQEEQSSMSEPLETNNKDKGQKAQWSPHGEQILFNILRKYIESKKVTQKEWSAESFRKPDWKLVRDEFNTSTSLQFTVEQITNKKKRWKQLWVKWKKVRNQTGVGWNEEEKTFDILDWDDIETKISGATAFKGKALPLLDEMHLIFGDDSADPSRGFSNLSQPLYQSSQNHDFIDLDDDVSPNTGTPINRKRYASPDPSCSMKTKSRRSSKEDDLVSAMHSINSTMNKSSVIQEAMQEFCRMGFEKEDMLRFHKHLSGDERFSNAEKFLAVNEEWRRAIVESLI